MKNPTSIALLVTVLGLSVGCDKSSSNVAKQLEELQRKTAQAEERQKDLERQIADQKLAAETEVIERERMQIEADRAELERTKQKIDSEQANELRKREEALATREDRIEQSRDALFDKEQDLSTRGAQLSDRESKVAGREALSFRAHEQPVPVGDYSNFYDSLSSYGSWFETPTYGYVWQPIVVRESNWRPYSRGRWICSDRGWTWASDEPFGWATYHYGRWARLRNRGWVWVPGSEWAPSWVSWRESGSHIGWAPLPPETLAYRNHRWDSSVEVQFGISPSWYNFVEVNHFGSSLYQYCLPVTQNITYINQTTNITYIHIQNRQVISGGPRYDDLNRRSERRIPFYRLDMDRHSRPSRDVIGMRPRFEGDRMMVSAPNMDAGWNEGLRPREVRGKIEYEVEREKPLRQEISDRFRSDRDERTRIASRTIESLGGEQEFNARRLKELEENRKEAETAIEKEVPNDPGSETLVTPEERPRPQAPEDKTPEPPDNRPIAPAEALPAEEVAVQPATKETPASAEVQAKDESAAATPPVETPAMKAPVEEVAPDVSEPAIPNPNERPSRPTAGTRELPPGMTRGDGKPVEIPKGKTTSEVMDAAAQGAAPPQPGDQDAMPQRPEPDPSEALPKDREMTKPRGQDNPRNRSDATEGGRSARESLSEKMAEKKREREEGQAIQQKPQPEQQQQPQRPERQPEPQPQQEMKEDTTAQAAAQAAAQGREQAEEQQANAREQQARAQQAEMARQQEAQAEREAAQAGQQEQKRQAEAAREAHQEQREMERARQQQEQQQQQREMERARQQQQQQEQQREMERARQQQEQQEQQREMERARQQQQQEQ